MRTLIAALLLLGLALTADATPSMPGPRHFIQVEPVGIGPRVFLSQGLAQTPEVDVMRLSAMLGRIRFGAALARTMQYDVALLPVHVGYTVYQRPVMNGSLYGMLPDVYAEAAAYVFNSDVYYGPGLKLRRPKGKLALCCDADYWLIGAGAEAGLWLSGGELLPTLTLRLRLVTNFGF